MKPFELDDGTRRVQLTPEMTAALIDYGTRKYKRPGGFQYLARSLYGSLNKVTGVLDVSPVQFDRVQKYSKASYGPGGFEDRLLRPLLALLLSPRSDNENENENTNMEGKKMNDEHNRPPRFKATVSVQRIDPSRAVELLEHVWQGQRNLRPLHRDKLAADMLANRFRLGPDAILIVKGELMNGQHRLGAVVESKKAQWFIVMESNDEELYKIIDAGLRRAVHDSLIGKAYSTKLSPISRWVIAYDLGRVAPGDTRAGDRVRARMTQVEVIDYCLKHAEVLSEAAAYTFPIYEQSRLLPSSMSGALYVLATRVGGLTLETAKEFLAQVYGGGGGKSAAEDLRNRLIANKGSKARLRPGYIFGIMLKAFRAYQAGKRPGVLKWQSDEVMPRIDDTNGE